MGLFKLEVSYGSLWLILWGEVKEVIKWLKGLRLKCLYPCYVNGGYGWNREKVIVMSKGIYNVKEIVK
jgi:hypothetical protein